MVYILAFFAIALIYTQVVLSNTSELTKNLLKLLTEALMISLFYLMQIFSKSTFVYKYSLDTAIILFCFAAYYEAAFAYQYTDTKMNNKLKLFYQVTGAIIIAGIPLNENTECFYAYEIVNKLGIQRAYPVPHLGMYAIAMYIISLLTIQVIVLYKNTKKRNSKETRMLVYLSLAATASCTITVLNFDTLQKNYNVIYWTLILKTVAYYVTIVKYEINSEISKIKLQTVENTGMPIIVTKEGCKIVKYNNSALNLFHSLNLIDTEGLYDISEIKNIEKVFEKNDAGLSLVKDTELLIVDDGSNVERYFKVLQTDVEVDSVTKLSLLTFEDMTSIKNKEYDLQKRSTIDQLTSVFNRNAFKNCALEMLQSSVNTSELVYLFMLDLDHFKSINDTYGHLTGDEFLKSTSGIISKVIGDNGAVGRYGGEEFCGVFKTSTEAEAKQLLESLRIAVLNNKIRVNKNDMKAVTVSVGYVRSNNKDANIDALYRFADIALYRAKRSGRNKVVEYSAK